MKSASRNFSASDGRLVRELAADLERLRGTGIVFIYFLLELFWSDRVESVGVRVRVCIKS